MGRARFHQEEPALHHDRDPVVEGHARLVVAELQGLALGAVGGDGVAGRDEGVAHLVADLEGDGANPEVGIATVFVVPANAAGGRRRPTGGMRGTLKCHACHVVGVLRQASSVVGQGEHRASARNHVR